MQLQPPQKYGDIGWYVPTARNNSILSNYLHSDGVVRISTKNADTGMFTGYFSTFKEAVEAINRYINENG